MRVHGTTNLPFSRGDVVVDTNGRVALGSLVVALPWERPQPHFMVLENDNWVTFATDGRAMLRQLVATDTRLEVRSGFTLLAALLIIEDGLTLDDLTNLVYERDQLEETHGGMTLALERDRFGLCGGSRFYFTEELHGKVNFAELNAGYGSHPGATAWQAGEPSPWR